MDTFPINVLDFISLLVIILSGIISYIPLVGTIAGFKGAMDVWGWSFIGAGALFFGPLVVYALLSFLISIGNRN